MAEELDNHKDEVIGTIKDFFKSKDVNWCGHKVDDLNFEESIMRY